LLECWHVPPMAAEQFVKGGWNVFNIVKNLVRRWDRLDCPTNHQWSSEVLCDSPQCFHSAAPEFYFTPTSDVQTTEMVGREAYNTS